MNFWQNFFFAFWFFLPAGMANIFASLSGNIPKLRNLSYPMDFFLTWRGKRILGEHKTIRGLFFGIIGGILTAYILKSFYGNSINPIILGALLGSGAILGDSVKSFFKRQMNIGPGDSFIFFDQIDYIVGGLILSSFYIRLNFEQYLYIIFIYFILHFIVNILGYLIGIRPKAI